MVEILSVETTIHDQIQTDQNIRLKPVPIHTLEIDTIQMTDQEILRTIKTEIIPTIRIEATRKIEFKDIKKIDHDIIYTKHPIIKDLITTTIKIDHAIIHKIEIRTITIDKETNQSPHRKNTRYPDSQNKYRNNTPKHQRHINQVQTTEEVDSDPSGIDNRESTELQLNHINCESRQ